MFSRIDPLFKTLFRHTENTDTRQDIKRKEPLHEHHKQKDEHTDPQDNPLWEDETDVSVEALSSFLHSLLGDKNPIFNQNAERPSSTTTTPSSYATNAYQKRAGNTPRTLHITETAPLSGDHATLSEKERPLVEQLLQDLSALKQQGVNYLILSRKGTFFDSVKDAIQEAHTQFNL